MATQNETTPAPVEDELHPGGAERPSEAAMREAAQFDAPADQPATTRSRKRQTPPTTDGKRVSGRDAIAKVLADGKPRKAGEITAAAVKLIRPRPTGKTPEATLSALLYTQAKKPDGLVVRTKKPGEFKLRPAKAAKTAKASA